MSISYAHSRVKDKDGKTARFDEMPKKSFIKLENKKTNSRFVSDIFRSLMIIVILMAINEAYIPLARA